MTEALASREPSVSVLLVRPCLRLLHGDPRIPAERLTPLEALDNEARVPVPTANALMQEAIDLTGDEDLGLKAGRMTRVEDGGVLTYAVFSAPKIQDAIGVGARYMRLLNDTVAMRLELSGERAVVRLDNLVPISRGVADYQASIVHTGFIRTLRAPGLEWWFPHARPVSAAEYEQTFSGAQLRFSTHCLGFAFDARLLTLQMPTADPALHSLIRRYGDMLLAQLPCTHEFSSRARDIIVNELAAGSPTIERIAARLHVSARTLRRRLETEGTTFSDLLNDTRHRLAVQYVAKPDLRMAEVALLLGFADVATFYRAFKRWTGRTPNSFRISATT